MSGDEHEIGLTEEEDDLDFLDSSILEEDDSDEEKGEEYSEFYEDSDDE